MTYFQTTVQRDTLEPAQLAKIEAVQAIDRFLGRRDFQFNVHEVLGHKFPAAMDPRVQMHLKTRGSLLRRWMDTRGTQKTHMKVMEVRPRETGKTQLGGIPMVEFLNLNDPDISIMYQTAVDKGMGDKFGAAIREIFNGEYPGSRLCELYGNFRGDVVGRDWSKSRMVTSKRMQTARTDPTVGIYTVRGGPTSGHFDVSILDDLTTEEELKKNAFWNDLVWDNYLRMHFVTEKTGLLWLIMTRYGDDDLCGRIIREEIEPVVRRLVLDGAPEGELPQDWDYEKGWIKYAHLAGWTVFYDEVYENFGTPEQRAVYTDIWPEERIEAVRATKKGEIYFQTQLMNQPAKRVDNPITPEMIRNTWYDSPQDIPPRAYLNVAIHCDFAFRKGDTYVRARDDSTVAIAAGKDGGHIWGLDGYTGYPTFDEFGRELIDMMLRLHDRGCRIRLITFDKLRGYGAGDESAERWIRRLIREHEELHMPVIRPLERTKNKWDKIYNTCWAWQEGMIHLPKDQSWVHPLVYQMQRLYYADHDDEADAFSDAFDPKWYKAPPEIERTRREYGRKDHGPTPNCFGEWDANGRFRAKQGPAFVPAAGKLRGFR